MTVAQAPAGLVFESMGTVVTLLSTVPIHSATTEAVESAFRELDERFSLYREDSVRSKPRSALEPDRRSSVQKAYDIDVLASAAVGTVWASPVFRA